MLFFVDGEDSTKDIKDTDEASGGADSSSANRKIELIKASAGWGGTTAFLKAEQDFSDAGWVLKIALKSPSSGGNSKIKAKLESLETPANPNDPRDIATQELEKSFTNDGTWQTVEWPVSEFNFDASKIDSSKIGKVVIVLSDANGATAGIGAQTIYYDEIRFARAADKTPPAFASGKAPAVEGSATANGATVKFTATEAGKVFWVLYASGTAAPTAAALIAAASGGSVGEQRSGDSVTVTIAEKTVTLTGLTAGSNYDFYAVLQDSAGNIGVVSAKVEITTAAAADQTPPTFNDGPQIDGDPTATGATVQLTASEAGKLFWVLYADNAITTAPSAAALIAAASGSTVGEQRSGDSVTVTIAEKTVTLTGLTAGTTYDFYAVLQDDAGNNGAVSTKLEITTVAVGSYTCINGNPASGSPVGNSDTAKCASCDSTYKLVNNACTTRTVYTCSNGTPASGSPAGNADVAKCQSCKSGYALNSNTLCAYINKDFNTLKAAGNDNPTGIWSDDTTMWVADDGDNKIYAYKMSDKSRDSAKDFDTLSEADNIFLGGIWSDGTTMWVADYSDDKIYAYKMSDKSRDSAKDFNTLKAAGNTDPYGIWSDGTTIVGSGLEIFWLWRRQNLRLQNER